MVGCHGAEHISNQALIQASARLGPWVIFNRITYKALLLANPPRVHTQRT